MSAVRRTGRAYRSSSNFLSALTMLRSFSSGRCVCGPGEAISVARSRMVRYSFSARYAAFRDRFIRLFSSSPMNSRQPGACAIISAIIFAGYLRLMAYAISSRTVSTIR